MNEQVVQSPSYTGADAATSPFGRLVGSPSETAFHRAAVLCNRATFGKTGGRAPRAPPIGHAPAARSGQACNGGERTRWPAARDRPGQGPGLAPGPRGRG